MHFVVYCCVQPKFIRMWLELIDASFFLPLYFVLLAASVIAGYFVAKKRYVARERKWTPSGVESSILGFFALLISFTLSSSFGSAKTRNALVHQEADAAAQLYRESLLSPVLQNEVQTFLVAHLEAQLRFYREEGEDADPLLHRLSQQSESFYQSIVRDSARTAAFARFSAAYNGLSSATYSLVYSYNERTPTVVMLLLIGSSLLIALLIGFMNGFHPKPHILVPLLYVLMVFFTLKTIRDLDDPQRGNVRPHYQNFEELRTLIARGKK